MENVKWIQKIKSRSEREMSSGGLVLDPIRFNQYYYVSKRSGLVRRRNQNGRWLLSFFPF